MTGSDREFRLSLTGNYVFDDRLRWLSAVIFPAMMKYNKDEWNSKSFVCITKEALKDAKPYALKKIMDDIMV